MQTEEASSKKDRWSNRGSSTLASVVLRLVIVALIDAFAIWFFIQLTNNDSVFLAWTVAGLTLFANVVILRNDAFPIRWMLAGLILMAIFAIYPIVFTIVVSTTNYGFGNLLTKTQAIAQLENPRTNGFFDEEGNYGWTAFRSEAGEFGLWLQQEGAPGIFAVPGEPLEQPTPGEGGFGQLDEEGVPATIDGYERLNRLTVARFLTDLQDVQFGPAEEAIIIRSMSSAAQLQPLYQYDSERDVMANQQDGTIYRPVEGVFISEQGAALRPGFQVNVGLANFRQFFTSPALQGPLVRIITWNFAFAFLSVLTTFALGLAVALIFQDRTLPGRRIIMTLLLIPYTIPSLISILVWRGMLDRELGIINRTLDGLIGWAPNWLGDEWWAKAAILLVNLWLGYPYFMLIASGALQSIPSDIYGAASVDGANTWQQFWRITLPLLLVAVGPLLVASFVFNFNNFNIIFLLTGGGPPIAGASTNAGHTDVLISYVYNLAFAGGRGAQYGLAAAITMVIFVIVAVLTLFQFRYTQMWEEVGENV